MKKKLFLLITLCFALFSSVTAFFVYRKRQLAEIARKEEERKHQEEEQKEKNNVNQEKKKKENEGNQEETDDPSYWRFFWKSIVSLIISFIITLIIVYRIIFPNDFYDPGCSCTEFITFTLILCALDVVVFPLIFAIGKYKDKSYWEHFKLIAKNFAITFIIFWIVFIILLWFNTPSKEEGEKKE